MVMVAVRGSKVTVTATVTVPVSVRIKACAPSLRIKECAPSLDEMGSCVREVSPMQNPSPNANPDSHLT